MIIAGIVLNVVGIGFFCWLLFRLAVYALPFFAGMTAGLATFHSGSGVVGALMVSVLAGGATLAIGQIAFRPVWAKHAKAAPFKRNDEILDVLPVGVIVCPGTGIQDNLADKAKKLGIPVWKFGASCA